jgi:hypothetical protein
MIDSGTTFLGIGCGSYLNHEISWTHLHYLLLNDRMFAFETIMRQVLRNPKLAANCDRYGRLGPNYYSCTGVKKSDFPRLEMKLASADGSNYPGTPIRTHPGTHSYSLRFEILFFSQWQASISSHETMLVA